MLSQTAVKRSNGHLADAQKVPRGTLIWEEGRTLLQLSVPAMATSLFSTLMLLVDSIFLGHLGPAELAAASLGSAYWNVIWWANIFIAAKP